MNIYHPCRRMYARLHHWVRGTWRRWHRHGGKGSEQSSLAGKDSGKLTHWALVSSSWVVNAALKSKVWPRPELHALRLVWHRWLGLAPLSGAVIASKWLQALLQQSALWGRGFPSKSTDNYPSWKTDFASWGFHLSDASYFPPLGSAWLLGNWRGEKGWTVVLVAGQLVLKQKLNQHLLKLHPLSLWR